jgi:hypothetical protein
MPHSGFTENVGPFRGLPNDDCGDASGRPAILEGELPGENRKRAKRVAGCPGIAASSTIQFEELGWAVSHRRGCRVVVLRITIWQS